MPLSDYTRLRRLGKGSFGEVYLVTDNRTQLQYVMKEIDLTQFGTKGRKEALKEVGFLNALNHPFIISYREFFENEPNTVGVGNQRKMLFIIMEYADGGDLSQRIKVQQQLMQQSAAAGHSNRRHHLPSSQSSSSSSSQHYFPEPLILSWFVQICLAVKHIHDRKIIHRDLKTENVFLMKDKAGEGTGALSQVKLGDFGISKSMANTMANAITRIGTPYYLSPEISMNKPYNMKSDMWSLGVILYELMSLSHPFLGNSMEELLNKIVRSQPAPLPKMYSIEIRTLCDALLQKQPSKRPNVNTLLQLPFLQKYVVKLLTPEVHQDEFSHTVIHSSASAMLKKGNGNQQQSNGNGVNGANGVASVTKPVASSRNGAAAPPQQNLPVSNYSSHPSVPQSRASVAPQPQQPKVSACNSSNNGAAAQQSYVIHRNAQNGAPQSNGGPSSAAARPPSSVRPTPRQNALPPQRRPVSKQLQQRDVYVLPSKSAAPVVKEREPIAAQRQRQEKERQQQQQQPQPPQQRQLQPPRQPRPQWQPSQAPVSLPPERTESPLISAPEPTLPPPVAVASLPAPQPVFQVIPSSPVLAPSPSPAFSPSSCAPSYDNLTNAEKIRLIRERKESELLQAKRVQLELLRQKQAVIQERRKLEERERKEKERGEAIQQQQQYQRQVQLQQQPQQPQSHRGGIASVRRAAAAEVQSHREVYRPSHLRESNGNAADRESSDVGGEDYDHGDGGDTAAELSRQRVEAFRARKAARDERIKESMVPSPAAAGQQYSSKPQATPYLQQRVSVAKPPALLLPLNGPPSVVASARSHYAPPASSRQRQPLSQRSEAPSQAAAAPLRPLLLAPSSHRSRAPDSHRWR